MRLKGLVGPSCLTVARIRFLNFVRARHGMNMNTQPLRMPADIIISSEKQVLIKKISILIQTRTAADRPGSNVAHDRQMIFQFRDASFPTAVTAASMFCFTPSLPPSPSSYPLNKPNRPTSLPRVWSVCRIMLLKGGAFGQCDFRVSNQECRSGNGMRRCRGSACARGI